MKRPDPKPDAVVIHAVFAFADPAEKRATAKDLLRTLRRCGCKSWKRASEAGHRRLATEDESLVVDVAWSWPDLALTIWGTNVEPPPGVIVEELARGLKPRTMRVWFGS